MTAYFAILKDSFREAIASRVLLISIIGLVVVLLLLAPFRIQYNQATALRPSEVTDPSRLLTELTSNDDNKPPVFQHLWNLLTEDEQSGFTELLPDDSSRDSSSRGRRGNRNKRRLVERLNQTLTKENFYDEVAWQDISQSDELKELLNTEGLTDQQIQRRNLLLLTAAFRRSISITDSSAIFVMYGSVEVFGPIPLTPTEFQPIFRQITVSVVAVFLGFFGVFGTLLITAGIIPRTFEPGEITLLASKPIRRSGLFLTKFVGGCIFTLLFAIVLVTGVWLILGLRMDSWNHRLLWCIPIYVFLFMIYYSVSAVTGVVWKNSIVSLTIVVLFWLFVFVVGQTQNQLHKALVLERGIKEIVVAGDDILTVDGQKQVWCWRAASETWEEVFALPPNRMNDFIRSFGGAGSVRFAPVFDSQQDRVIAIQANQSPFGGRGAPELIVGSANDDWERESKGRIPTLASILFADVDFGILVLSQDKILKFDDQQSEENQEAPPAGLLNQLSGGLLGQKNNGFAEIQPDDYAKMSEYFSASLVPVSGDLMIYDAGQLRRFTRIDGRYQEAKAVSVESDLAATVAATDQICVLCLRDGTVSIFDSQSLEFRSTFGTGSGIVPKRSEVSPDSKYIAILTHDETIMIFDGQTGERISWSPPENGSCSALAFDSESRLLLSNGRLAVQRYDLSIRERDASWAQAEPGVYAFYDYAISPLWTLLPRPRQLDRFAKWTLDGEQEVLASEDQGPPRSASSEGLLVERERFSPSQVLLKNALFIVVLLGLGCFYVQRADF